MSVKPVSFFARTALLLSAFFLAAGAVTAAAQSKKAAVIYGEVIAKPGQSEVIVENTLPSPVTVFINGRLEGTVKARDVARFVVADGNNYIRTQSTAKGGGSSRDVQFYTQAKRFVFKVTGPNNFTVHLSRESAHDITAPNTASGPAAPEDPPLAETSLGKDKAAMFERLDQQTAPKQTPAPTPAPAAAVQPSSGGSSAAAAAPAQQNAAAQPAGPKAKVAVYVTGDKSDSERKALGTKLLVALVNSGKYVAVERSDDFLAEIDKEHMKQRDNTVDDGQISSLGKQFGVQYICVANIAEAFGAYQVSARIIDVETAVVVAVGESNSALRSMDDLSGVSFRVVKALLKE